MTKESSLKKASLKKILESPDREEITSKLLMGRSPKDIHEWLKAKYTDLNDSSFILSEKLLKTYQDDYLDIVDTIQKDLVKTKSNIEIGTELELAVKSNITYQNALQNLATTELDIKQIILKMVAAIETRTGQVFDKIQQDETGSIRNDRILMEWFDRLGMVLERYYKLVNEPAAQMAASQTTNNYTFNMVDESVTVMYDIIKEILSKMDVELSLHFMELFNEKMSKLKEKTEQPKTADDRLIEAKLLTEKMSKL